ncbi:Glyoxylase, beta-lactamase superfamily II [Halogranum amylolyticum]|uniref:Glyoxylase, beta-lactamase superfamily II n=1 Tax=Halogranum amylolyticum TaxID=660520 RepID=A0A1H8PKX0_9EURY|nr:MBL fold metallo-hydrolase [Halogranum amylolyticum]SEO42348.1 Glyoxylase, beta-lactamase superfamily II [Halogranum amylolyticum]
MDIARVSVSVDTRAPTGQTYAYLLGSTDALLVDPAGRSERLDALVAERDVAHVAVTHTHSDHVGAVAHYADVTGATVWGHEDYVERFEDATGRTADRTFGEGTRLPVDGREVAVLDTPGHAPDHVAFAVDDDIVSGDLAVAEGSVVVGAPEGDMIAYVLALLRLQARAPDRLLPGHGPAIREPNAVLARLVDHRLDREQRVFDAVADGARDVDAVLNAAYEKDLTGVRDLARATVVAHVEKLAEEGRVDWDAETERAAPAERTDRTDETDHSDGTDQPKRTE